MLRRDKSKELGMIFQTREPSTKKKTRKKKKKRKRRRRRSKNKEDEVVEKHINPEDEHFRVLRRPW